MLETDFLKTLWNKLPHLAYYNNQMASKKAVNNLPIVNQFVPKLTFAFLWLSTFGNFTKPDRCSNKTGATKHEAMEVHSENRRLSKVSRVVRRGVRNDFHIFPLSRGQLPGKLPTSADIPHPKFSCRVGLESHSAELLIRFVSKLVPLRVWEFLGFWWRSAKKQTLFFPVLIITMHITLLGKNADSITRRMFVSFVTATYFSTPLQVNLKEKFWTVYEMHA